MATADEIPDAMHFAAITLENVRAFRGRQSLNLTDDTGMPLRWCLILGENGVGKTTILQALALMKPVPAFPTRKTASDAGTPRMSQPEISERENADIQRLVRSGSSRTEIAADLLDSTGTRCSLTVEIFSDKTDKDLIGDVKVGRARYALRSAGPLVIGYGAARHIGHGNKSDVADRDATWSLFSDAFGLYDAEELLDELDHASKSGPTHLRQRDRKRLKAIFAAVASLLDGISPKAIDYRGPKTGGRKAGEYGVYVETRSATVPLSELSLGYQSMFAWTVDLAYRLIQAYPDSDRPTHESAVVLIDEIDLHLHPRWQRTLRTHLLKHFPKVQFIATTHSPVTAQETLSEGGRVAIVQWEGEGTTIDSDPLPVQEWRIDQLMTSELFGFGMPRSLSAEGKMQRRAELTQKERLSPAEKAELGKLDAFADSLPVTDPEASSLIEEFRKLRGQA